MPDDAGAIPASTLWTMSQASSALACNGQPGVKKDGVDRMVTVSGTALSGLVALLGSPAAAIMLQAVVAGIQYDTLHLCELPDPGDPNLTQDDLAALANYFDVIALSRATQRVNQWVQHMMWPIWCNCSDGSAPPANTTAPLPPAGINTGLPVGTGAAPCWDVHIGGAYPANAAGTTFTNVTLQYLPGPLVPGFIGSQTDGFAATVPPGVTKITVTAASHWEGSATTAATVGVDYFNATKGYITSQLLTNSVNTGFTNTYTLAAGTSFWAITVRNPTGNSTFLTDIQLSFLCEGQAPGDISVPCCPPDPALDARLYRIQQLEEIIINLLSSGAGSHIDGTRHSNLQHAGSIQLVDQVDAIRVEVTSSLTGWPSNPGVPTYFFSLGFITSIAAESPLKGWRLVYGSQTFPIASYADSIGYTLPPGVSIDIIELLPGP